MDGRPVQLDPTSDNVPPDGFTVVNSARSLVEHSLDDCPLFVQGDDLCEWVATLGAGRGWQVSCLKSPTQELRRLCPELTAAEAQSIISELRKDLPTLRRPLQVEDVLRSLWEDALEILRERPWTEHAIRWLAWIARRESSAVELKLARALRPGWWSSAPADVQWVYQIGTPPESWAALKQWLSILPPERSYPPLPRSAIEALPRVLWQRLEDELRVEAIRTDTDFFLQLLGRAPAKEVLQTAARVCADVLLSNPEKITADRVRRLAPYVNYDTEQKLRSLLPVSDPGLPVWQFDALRSWFMDRYLPYRERVASASHPAPDLWVSQHAEAFARGFLDFFARVRLGHSDADGGILAWVRSAALRRGQPNQVYLLVVFDGLTFPDARRLRSHLENASRRLSLDVETVAVAPVPTVTEFAKAAVARGLPPAKARENVATSEVLTTEEQVALVLRAAREGDVVSWAVNEPDRTYHFRADAGPATIRREVDAQLQAFARTIVALVEQAPETIRLRVVVTSDHGRLLSPSQRTEPIPEGMKAHGRAAWGTVSVPFGSNGVWVEGGIAYLHPTWFGLPPGQCYACLLTDRAFRTTDDRGGEEPYPHGGLFPEEVLIPWLEFTRDRAPVTLGISLQGRGEEGKAGTADLVITNSGPLTVRAILLHYGSGEPDAPLEVTVPPLTEIRATLTLPRWPSQGEIAAPWAMIFQLPDGTPVRQEFHPELEVESLYERPPLLDDLEEL